MESARAAAMKGAEMEGALQQLQPHLAAGGDWKHSDVDDVERRK